MAPAFAVVAPALKALIPRLRARGYRLVTLKKLLGRS